MARACRCNDSTTCHDPESHALRAPIRFAPEPAPGAPEYLCIDCGEVEVSDLHERCCECLAAYDDNKRDDYADRLMCLREGR